MNHAAYLPVYGRPAADGSVTLLALKPWALCDPQTPFDLPSEQQEQANKTKPKETETEHEN